jgi:ABC-type sugar transport system substrate-binding protein
MGTKASRAVTRRDLLKLSAAGVAVAGVASMGLPAFAQQRKRIALAHPDRAADYYQGFMNAALAEAEKQGYDILQSFSGMDPQKQLAEVNTWLAQGIDALVVLALDANAMAPIVAKVHEQKALFISYANRIEGEDGYIKWADRDAGALLGAHAAKHIKEKLGGSAEVGFLTATNIQVVTDRIESTREAILAELPDTKFFEATALNAPDALKATQTLLQAHPEMKIVICCTDDGALGARSAYQNSGLAAGQRADRRLRRRQAEPRADQGARSVPAGQSMALDIGDIGRRVVDIPHQLWNGGPASETQRPAGVQARVARDGRGRHRRTILSVYS